MSEGRWCEKCQTTYVVQLMRFCPGCGDEFDEGGPPPKAGRVPSICEVIEIQKAAMARLACTAEELGLPATTNKATVLEITDG